MATIDVKAPEIVEQAAKKWHDGKTTYSAAIATLLISVGGMLGFSFNETLPIEIARFGDFVEYTVYIVLAGIAWWGRAKALSPGFLGKKRLEESSK